MNSLSEKLQKDVRFIEGLKACIGCGTCTAICPAASIYKYEPRTLLQKVQKKNDEIIKELISSDFIWYCGECMSCKTRCPRGNIPGLVITALRTLSIKTGYFVESEKGRQQYILLKTIGNWILETGYCLYLKGVTTEEHPELGPVWDWVQENYEEVMKKLGANFNGEGPGILRKIPEKALEELRAIFRVTGGLEYMKAIEKFSENKAKMLGYSDIKEYKQRIKLANFEKHHK